jgi:hypothetical protein
VPEDVIYVLRCNANFRGYVWTDSFKWAPTNQYTISTG